MGRPIPFLSAQTGFLTADFVTTFPCHACARHIVVAGVREVQYIEPYRKSRTIKLHDDAATLSANEAGADRGGKVLFRPFTGVAPRRYRQFFDNDRTLKDGMTGARSRPVAPPPWGRPGQQIKAARRANENLARGEGQDDGRGNGAANGQAHRPNGEGAAGLALTCDTRPPGT